MSRKSKKEKRAASAGWANLKLRVMAEYCSSGIWVIGQHGVWRHGMVSHSLLRLPADLSKRFEQWIDFYSTQLDDANFDTLFFNHTGRALATELKAHLGMEVYVEFVPESIESNGIGTAEEINLITDPLLRLIGSLSVDIPDLAENHDYYIGQALFQELKRDE